MARKDSKQRQSQNAHERAGIARVQRYHERSNHSASNYAYDGFKANRYYTSDRFIELDASFNRPDGKPLKGFGLEIELTSNSINNTTVLAEILDKVVFSHFPAYLFKQQSDSSLGGTAASECITQVMTREFIRNHYPEFKLMYDVYFPNLGINSDLSCGMHCNISNAVFGSNQATIDTCIRKLYYIINKHYDRMCIMLHRDRSHTAYAGRMNYSMDYAKTFDLASQFSSHGVSFNLGHYSEGRIEVRLVGNQPTYAAFRNTMETIFFLCDRVKKLSWSDCDDFAKIWQGCNQHVYDRLTLCRDLPADQLLAVRSTVNPVDFG